MTSRSARRARERDENQLLLQEPAPPMRERVRVASVRVDLARDAATVVFDPVRVSPEAIGAAIERAGYEPLLADAVPELELARPAFLVRLGLRR